MIKGSGRDKRVTSYSLTKEEIATVERYAKIKRTTRSKALGLILQEFAKAQLNKE